MVIKNISRINRGVFNAIAV